MNTNELLKEYFEGCCRRAKVELIKSLITFLKEEYGTCKNHQEGCMSCEVTKTIKLLRKVIKDLDE
jgi:hypothetical protein